MNIQNSTASDDPRIREIIDDRITAIRAKDADGVLRHYAPDLVTFDLAPPLANAGEAALDRQGLEGWFATWRGPIGLEARDVHVRVGGDIAFARGFYRISGTKTDGERPNIWVRGTHCFARADGVWKIVHEHMSVPFYMDGSYKAAIDLKP